MRVTSSIAAAAVLVAAAAEAFAAAPAPTPVTPQLIEAATKEGKVVYYTAIDLKVAARVFCLSAMLIAVSYSSLIKRGRIANGSARSTARGAGFAIHDALLLGREPMARPPPFDVTVTKHRSSGPGAQG
jgi:hypothetical protein